MSERKKGEHNPIAAALGWCMSCPTEHTLRRHAEAVVIDAIALSYYEYDAAELLGVTPLYLSTLLAKYPNLRPQSGWAEKRKSHLRTVMDKLESSKRKATK